MKRVLLRSSAFIRRAKRVVKKHPHVINDIQAVLELLSEDAFHPQLKTHKLKGNLVGSWACSAGYDLRLFLNSYNMKNRRQSFWKQSEATKRFTELCPRKFQRTS